MYILEPHILLVPVKTKRDLVDAVENNCFNNEGEIISRFGGSSLVYPLTTFALDCNDVQIDLDHYWITIVQIKKALV